MIYKIVVCVQGFCVKKLQYFNSDTSFSKCTVLFDLTDEVFHFIKYINNLKV